MEITILGSGGAINTPRAFCQCKMCNEAREKGVPYSRNGPSAYFKEINTIIDTPEDIQHSINRENIKEIENVFITHWHPDHVYGLRFILESYYDWAERKPLKKINLYVPKEIYPGLKEIYGTLDYHTNIMKLVNLIIVEDFIPFEINDSKITPISYDNSKETFGYLIETERKRIFYSPCDTISFSRFDLIENLDLWITEVGIWRLNEEINEVLHTDVIKRIEKVKPKKSILVHIEEVDKKSFDTLKELEKEYSNIFFSHDGLKIII